MKSQKLFKYVALMLALVLCLGLAASCVKKEGEGAGTTPTPVPGGATPAPGTSDVKQQTTPLVVAYDNFSQKFSPFFATTGYDQDVAAMTQAGCMVTDRVGDIVYNALDGEDREYNGKSYHYSGCANISVEYNERKDETVYRIELGKEIQFSDGEYADIDDVIFYFYVVLDPYYTGASTLSSQPIIGYQEYRYNNSDAVDYDPTEFLEDIDNQEDLQEAVAEFIKGILDSELEWVGTLYGNDSYAAYTEAYPDQKDLMYYMYGLEYDLDDEDDLETVQDMSEKEIMNTLYEEYGYNYKQIGINYGGDEKYFIAEIEDMAKRIGLEASGEGEEVPNVEGINRVDDYTVEVTTDGFSANAVYQICAATIVPMHYYGDADLYDYENNEFGFKNREADSMELIEEKTTEPMGAGPYKFVEFKDKVVYFESNDNYYDGRPIIKYVQFKETAANEKISAVATEAVDIASDITGSVDAFDEISGYNTDTNTETGNTITSSLVWNLGYGYIGINADAVNVAGEPDSEESKNLRKGLATIIAVHRDTVINTFYGTAAAVIQYPISSTSWAAPQVTDEGYQVAFSRNIDGDNIFESTGGDVEDMREAAIEAAIEYFKAAGYTWDKDEEKFTEAPEGAKLEYEIIIPGGGSGDHPNYDVAANANKDLEEIGMALNINDPVDSNVLWDALAASTHELWTAAWGSTIDPDMYQVYYSTNIPTEAGGAPDSSSSNHYHIQDDELDDLILDARTSDDPTFRKNTYKECLDIIMDWAVEIPTYQRKNVVIFSTERIDLTSIDLDGITTYWGWMAEIHHLKMIGD